MDGEFFFRRFGTSLIPADLEAEVIMEKITRNEVVRVKISNPRNPKQHALMFSLLTKCIEGGADFISAEALLVFIKLELGHCDILVFPDGSRHRHPRSISFSAMPQVLFRGFFDSALTVICEKVLPSVDREDLLQEIYKMLDPTDVASAQK